jgi:hypothetical protein
MPPAAKKRGLTCLKDRAKRSAANVIGDAVKVMRIAIGEETEERPAEGLR